MRNIALICVIAILVAGCISSAPAEEPEAPAAPATPAPETPAPATPAPVTPTPVTPPAPEPEPEPEPVVVEDSCTLNSDCGIFAGCLDGECMNIDPVFIDDPGASYEIDILGCSDTTAIVRVNNKALHSLPVSVILKQDGVVLGTLDEGAWQDREEIKEWDLALTEDYNPTKQIEISMRFKKFFDHCNVASCELDSNDICHVA